MAGLFNLAKFLPRGRGRLSRIEEMIDRHSRIFEGIDAEDRATVRPNPRGGFTISATGSRGSGLAVSYASYFKLYDASTRNEAGEVTECKIGVQDGGSPSSSLCGVAVLNGTRIDVDKHSEAVSASGTAWLIMSITGEGETAEIVIGGPGYNPEPPEPAVAYTGKLLGRFTVSEGENPAITGINQDYLAGGEHSEFIFADCEEQEEE